MFDPASYAGGLRVFEPYFCMWLLLVAGAERLVFHCDSQPDIPVRCVRFNGQMASQQVLHGSCDMDSG